MNRYALHLVSSAPSPQQSGPASAQSLPRSGGRVTLAHRTFAALKRYVHDLRAGLVRHFDYQEADRDHLCLSHAEPQIHIADECPSAMIGWCVECSATRLLTRTGRCNACGSASVDQRRFVR